MTLWFVFALMTAAAIFAVLWPLGRKAAVGTGGQESLVYKDQLAEVGRDADAGLIGRVEAQAARVEISRRLLASSEAEQVLPPTASIRTRRVVAVLALIGLPILAVGLYAPLGSPSMPDFPLAARVSAPDVNQPLENLVTQVESHLEKNPTDGRGWTVIAPVLSKLGRFDDAARAYRNAITYAGDTAARRSDLGEALAAAANGVVTAEAKTEFERAVALDGSEVKARFFLGLAAEQDGRMTDAAAIWRAMLEAAPADAPWRPMVQSALQRVGGPAMPKLSEDTVAAAQGMSKDDQTQMIKGMVDGLAARLAKDGTDVQGWLRLVRAYMVMGDRDKAGRAGSDGRAALATDVDRLKQLNDGLKNLGLDG